MSPSQVRHKFQKHLIFLQSLDIIKVYVQAKISSEV